MNNRLASLLCRTGMIAFVGLLLGGCATQRIDWSQRIGAYTYDQAVLELGPPDKEALLEDGTRVAEWLTRRGYVYSHPTYFLDPYPYYAAPLTPTYYSSPDYFLRLTFGPDGNLRDWKRLVR